MIINNVSPVSVLKRTRAYIAYVYNIHRVTGSYRAVYIHSLVFTSSSNVPYDAEEERFISDSAARTAAARSKWKNGVVGWTKRAMPVSLESSPQVISEDERELEGVVSTTAISRSTS